MKEALVLILQNIIRQPKRFSAVMGFDACIDNITRVIKEKDQSHISYFDTVKEFGTYVASKEHKSCGLDLRTRISKIGGNMPITANALGALGFDVNCIGTFGWPDIMPVFKKMSPNCNLTTIGETVITTALEFDDAKIMMCDLQPYESLNWETLKNNIGIDNLTELFRNKQLTCFLNWSEIENSGDIWKGILNDVLPNVRMIKKQKFFCDFSDCSRKPEHEIAGVIKLLGQLQKYYDVHLSLNQNEAELVAKALKIEPTLEMAILLSRIASAIPGITVIIHRTQDAWIIQKEEIVSAPTFFIQKPVLLTGAGDNFNAGYCFALLHDLCLKDSVILANACAGFYVKNGFSADVISLIQFLEEFEYP